MRPMLATPGALPEGPMWCYEVHWSGLRVLAEVSDATMRIVTGDGQDVTERFPELSDLAGRLADGLFDAELVVLEDGAPSAAALAERLRPESSPVQSASLLVFDVLRLYGVPLLARSLSDRRATLERIGIDAAEAVSLSPVYRDGPALLAAIRRHRLPGVIAKRYDAPYRPGTRDPAWVEVGVDG